MDAFLETTFLNLSIQRDRKILWRFILFSEYSCADYDSLHIYWCVVGVTVDDVTSGCNH